MRLKEGVLCAGLHPKIVEAMCKVSALYAVSKITGVRACITSVMDSRHSGQSLHYKGRAFDVRTWRDSQGNQMLPNEKEALADRIRDVLGEGYDVVVESTHIHIEYDPKEK